MLFWSLWREEEMTATKEKREWDIAHPLPSQVLAWVRRLQYEFYCNMSEDLLKRAGIDGSTCNCLWWCSGVPLHRFWLCRDAKPKWTLAYKKLFGSDWK